MPWRHQLNYARLHVSIHAPRFREAMLTIEDMSIVDKLFQSTPPVSGRRCNYGEVLRLRINVSIHAPRFREAMRWLPVGCAVGRSIVSIHAPRFREAMRSRLE